MALPIILKCNDHFNPNEPMKMRENDSKMTIDNLYVNRVQEKKFERRFHTFNGRSLGVFLISIAY